MEQFEAYFQRADTDRDGRISGNEAVAFFQGFNLPKQVLAQIWTYADQNRTGFLGRPEFFNALKLVTVAQTKRDLTPELVKVALYGPASTKIPAPQINLASAVSSNSAAGTSPAQISGMLTSSQSIGVRGPLGFSSQPSQVMRPPRPPAISSQLVTPRPGFSGGGLMAIPHSNSHSNSSIGTTDGHQPITPSVSNRNLNTSATPEKLGPTASTVFQPKTPALSGLVQSPSFKANESALGFSVGKEESNSLSATGNGLNSSKDFGDAFSTMPYLPKNNSPAPANSASSMPATSSSLSVSSFRNQPTNQLSSVSQSPSAEAQQFHSTQITNQRNLAPNPAPAGGVTSVQSQSPWPKLTQLDVQKYSKVFLQVDTDRDGKITGEQARTLFLSWGLPREVLKQVWDLSDQDNDSMLSLREFCVALYLMERYREGRSLPTVLPNTIISDDMPVPASGQAAAAYGNMPFRPAQGFQQPQPQGTKSSRHVTSTGGGKPPRPVHVPQPDEPMQQKPKVPDLEKHLVDQLSTEEQDSLNKKFEEAKDAEKKVADLEKDILEARQKIQFYHGKMQELVLHKSRCDSRLNEILEKVVADKTEAESLAKKYEEKYRQTGDVASKLTIEEATFRDIQEKKMELYRAIAKLDQENAEIIHDRANQIQSDLEELVKVLNERCKAYGVRGKPTSLVELPFGWQTGIQGTAADWDEVWDKFEDEGFSYVKELTLEVENVAAPPKPKTPLIREKVIPLDNGGDSVRSPSGPSSVDRLPDNEKGNSDNMEQTMRTPPDSPAGSNSFDSPSKKYQGKPTYDFNINGSPHAFDSQSKYGEAESVSGDKSFDEPGWGAYDIHYDSDAAWDFNPTTPRDADRDRRESSLFGSDDWVLNPIKTGSAASDSSLKQGPFFDSVPSTPLYSSANSPQAGMFTRSFFEDSVPSTPMYNYNTSPKAYNDGYEEPYSFDSFSKTESFNMSDIGPFGSREPFTRFDSMRSTRDSDYDQGYFGRQDSSLARFDSFRSTADSDYNFGATPQTNSFSRFDSSRTNDWDHRHSFHSFDDTSDPFGSGEPFRTSIGAETPKKDSDGWKAF